MTEFCFHCGVDVQGEWRFCRRCGTGVDAADVAVKTAFCTTCGSAIAESWRFCTTCGTDTPVAMQARSKHLTPEQTAQMVGAAAGPGLPDAPDGEAAQAELEKHPLGPRPSVELISKGWDVIDLRPLEDDEGRYEAPDPAGGAAAPPQAPAPPVAVAESTTHEAPQPPPTTGAEAAGRGHAPTDVAVEERAVPAERADEPAAVQRRKRAAANIPLERYEDPTTVGRWAQLAILGLGMAAVVAVIGLIILNNRLEEFGSGTAGQDRILSVQDAIDGWIRPVVAIAALLAAGALITWTYRVYSNLIGLGKPDLRLPPHAALWSWFVPLLNLIVPKQLIDDAWRGTDVYAAFDADWKRRPGNGWVLAFWAGLLGFGVLTIVGGAVGSDTVEQAMDANGWAMLGYGALILACLAAVRMIASISDRQIIRYRSIRDLL